MLNYTVTLEDRSFLGFYGGTYNGMMLIWHNGFPPILSLRISTRVPAAL
jgi:hypothetical protein